VKLALLAGVFPLLIVLALAGLAVAADNTKDTIADGVTVGGVDVGGLTRAQAVERLDNHISEPASRPVKVKVAGETRKLTADDAGVEVDIEGAADRALAASQDGSFVSRGWREVAGGKLDEDLDAAVSVNERAVSKFVKDVEEDVHRPAVDAELSMDVTDVAVSPDKKGRELADSSALKTKLVRAFETPGSKRRLKAKTEVIKPKVTERDVWAKNPVVVTVAHDAQTVRVFKEGDVVATYRVAVGADEFPTPRGRFAVDRMETNPVWNVPDSDWAGGMAGQTIPGGDPRNPLVARWVGISGPVGFHGTKDIGSLGSRASHGCVRMNPSDVIDLYDRVEVGTPILIA
jgi:lipoprotein-anchoring transpeptidase ErfK/SrfK